MVIDSVVLLVSSSYTAITKHHKKVVDHEETIVSLALITALFTACGSIEIHFADPEDVQNAVETSGSMPSAHLPTTQQRTMGSSQETVKLTGANLMAKNEPDTSPEQQNDEAASVSEEEQEASAVSASDS